MKVTIYTINDTESDFCKQAKDFLTSHNIPFENKDVEHDRKALSEMLALSDNFSGVPVIVVEEDGAEKKVLKGFTQQEVEQALGLSEQPTDNNQQSTVQTPATQTGSFAPAQDVAPAPEEKVEPNTQQMDQTMSLTQQPTDNSQQTTADNSQQAALADDIPTTPAASVTQPEEHDDQLKGIMDTLHENSQPFDYAQGKQPTPAELPTDNSQLPTDVPPVEAPTPTPAALVTEQVPTTEAMTATPAETPTSAPMSEPAPAEPASAEPPTANYQSPTTDSPSAAPAGDMPSIPDFQK